MPSGSGATAAHNATDALANNEAANRRPIALRNDSLEMMELNEQTLFFWIKIQMLTEHEAEFMPQRYVTN